jgi:hypothetical protein
MDLWRIKRKYKETKYFQVLSKKNEVILVFKVLRHTYGTDGPRIKILYTTKPDRWFSIKDRECCLDTSLRYHWREKLGAFLFDEIEEYEAATYMIEVN